MNFDITMTATIRPEIFEKSLKSIMGNIIEYNNKFNFRLIINIDPIGETNNFNQETIEEITKKYHKNSVFVKPNQPDFPTAIKNIWNLVESDFMMHTEDDRIFMREVDLEDIINKFDSNTGICWIQGKLNRLSKFGFKVSKINDYWSINDDKKDPKCLLTMHPCIYRREMLKDLVKYVRKGASPEKVLRLQDTSQLNNSEVQQLKNIINNWEFIVYSNHNSGYSKDIGREWKENMGFSKNRTGRLSSVKSTWIKNR